MTTDDDRIRDLEKAVNAVHARISKNSEYAMKEWRLNVEDMKDLLTAHAEKIDAKLTAHKDKTDARLSSLERWRSFLAGAYATTCMAVGAWFKTSGAR